MRKSVQRLTVILMVFAVAFTSLPIMTGGFEVSAAAPSSRVKSFWASRHDVGKVAFKWTKKDGYKVNSWQIKYRTKTVNKGKWSNWTYKNINAMQATVAIRKNCVIEIHVRAKGDKSWSQGVITIPAGSTYQAMKTVYVKNPSTGKRVDSISLTVGQIIKLMPDYDYSVKDYKKRPRLYSNHMLYDIGNKNLISITKPNAQNYTGGLIDGVAKIKALKAGTTTLVCRAPNGRTKVLKITVKAAAKKTASVSKDSKFKVSMYDSEYDIYTDGSKITITAASSGKIAWTSSNTAVATVKASGTKGIVTLLKAGKTTITATNYDGQKKSVVFTVKDATPKSSDSSNTTILCDASEFFPEGAEWVKANVPANASEVEKVKACIVGTPEILAIAYPTPEERRAAYINCTHYAGALRSCLNAAGIKNEERICSDDRKLMGSVADELYGKNMNLTRHVNNWVWVDGVKYILDYQCGAVRCDGDKYSITHIFDLV